MSHLLPLALLLCGPSVLAQAPSPCTADALTTHAVGAGTHSFSPGHEKRLRSAGSPDTFQLSLKLPPGAWFDPSDAGPIQRDGMDWNKAGGVSYLSFWRPGTWRMNAAAAMIGWRPALGGDFAWCLYVNREDASFEFSAPQPLPAGTCVSVTVVVAPDCVTARWRDGSGQECSFAIEAAILLGRRIAVSPWFGGNREAPMDITLETALRLGGAD